MPIIRKSQSYYVACLLCFLLVYGIFAKIGIAPETPERDYEKDLNSVDLSFGTSILARSFSHSERLCKNTRTPDGIVSNLRQFSLNNMYSKLPKKNKYLSPSFSISIEVSNTKIIEGNSFTLEVLIENEGDSEIEDVTVSMSLPLSLTSSSTNKSLGTIFGCGAGVSCKAFVSFTIFARDEGTHTITVSVSAANTATVSDSVTVTVLPSKSTEEGIFEFQLFNMVLGFTVLILLFRIRRKHM